MLLGPTDHSVTTYKHQFLVWGPMDVGPPSVGLNRKAEGVPEDQVTTYKQEKYLNLPVPRVCAPAAVRSVSGPLEPSAKERNTPHSTPHPNPEERERELPACCLLLAGAAHCLLGHFRKNLRDETREACDGRYMQYLIHALSNNRRKVQRVLFGIRMQQGLFEE